MEVGIFTPIGNNGWLISENSPQYMPTDLNRRSPKTESYGVVSCFR
jgi:pyrimidine oxygenase